MQRSTLSLTVFGVAAAILLFAGALFAQPPMDSNEPGILEPVTSALENADVRVPNTDQSIDGVEQSNIEGASVIEDTFGGGILSMLGHEITHVESPNDDMRTALQALVIAAQNKDDGAMQAAANELMSILFGTTQGRIYDGFSMLNYNRWKDRDASGVGPDHFAPNIVPEEYKMKVARDTGRTFESPFDGAERKIWEVDVNMLYYDGQIDSDTFLVKFPMNEAEGFHNPDDVLHVNYRIFSLVQEDFSPTLVMLDRRMTPRTVSFPFKGLDSVWIAFEPGEVLNVTVKYPPVRMIRGVYTWGWRVHPPRIQFLQPVYEMVNGHTGEVQLDPQGYSFAFRNREDLTLSTIAEAAPEMKMYKVAKAVLGGTNATIIEDWLTREDKGPHGTWFDWADLVKNQNQLPPEAWDQLIEEGLKPGDHGSYNMISAFLNNEMYGEGPFGNEIKTWDQGEVFKVELINLDKHTHYFRNVDFGGRLHDDIGRCCGGGETSFEIMNFKPSYGAPKVAEMQWRAGWGFRPHYDVIQQQNVFPRGQDRVKVSPYMAGNGETHFGYQYSEEARGGDFRFNPPPFVIQEAADPSEFPLREIDGSNGLLIGQFTEGYGTGQICPDDPFPGFCATDIQAYNPHNVRNWPPPPLQGQGLCGERPEPCELRWPPFLRNPSQGQAGAGDIIPPTVSWRPFLWINPNNGTLWNDPNDHSKGHWADETMSHGAPVLAGERITATIELPRASGQVFYQFDDLFHDNSIFSPHPVFAGFGDDAETDAVKAVRAFVRNDTLRVRGRLEPTDSGLFAEWVKIYPGADATEAGCGGQLLAVAPVDDDGKFVFRCGENKCVSPVVVGRAADGATGSSICVESTVGGFALVDIE